ncbi:MAG: hypothetical protein ABJB55_02640 [Actinomycetota bacterium]
MGQNGARRLRRAITRFGTAAAMMLALAGLLAPAAHAAASPDLTITKSSDAGGSLSVGDRFSYTITVSNVGAASAHKVVVQDNLPRGLAVRTVAPQFPGGSCTVTSSQLPPAPPSWSVRCTRDALDAGGIAAVSFEVEVTGDVRCGALMNKASVAASDEPAAAAGDDHATATDAVACTPSITLATTAPAYARIGTRVPFSMRVRNDGEVALGSVDLTGPGCSPMKIGNGNGDATLDAGESWTYRCARAVGTATPDPLTATATVVARTDTEQKVTARDGATVRILDPGLSISVSPDPVSGTLGETITYTYVVTNVGDATVSDISIDDDHLGHVGDIAQLQAGHAITLHADRTVSGTNIWVRNTATARGMDASGHSVSADDDATVTIVASGHGGHSGGTAFTGLDTTATATAAMLLALLGVSLLLAARRRV